MAVYKQKTKQYIINAAKQPVYMQRGDVMLFNLNACFVKKNNYARYEALITEAVATGVNRVNLGNLASLCYKLEMDYASQETFDFVQTIVEIARQDKVFLVQDEIKSYGEVDMQPIKSLISYDGKSNVIYTNFVLVECLKVLGYQDSQVRDVVNITRDFRKIVPEDLIAELPIKNKKNNKAYERIKALF